MNGTNCGQELSVNNAAQHPSSRSFSIVSCEKGAGGAGRSGITIAIDIREACREERTGKGQWSRGFVMELIRRDINLIFFSDASIPEQWHTSRTQTLIFAPGMFWHVKVMRTLSQLKDIDYYVSPTSYIVPAFLGRKVRTIPIIHDLIAFRSEPHCFKAMLIERLLLRRVVKGAARICAVSENTKRDLLSQYPLLDPVKISTIFAGPLIEHPSGNTPDNCTILCVGTLCPRKNQLRLINAYSKLHSQLRSQYELVLIGGRGWHDRAIVKTARKTPGVSWRGPVSDAGYKELLQRCTILALPSLYEGFGLQILDAFQRGIPLLTSDRGSIPEVTGDAAVVVDPEDVDSIASGLEMLLKDDRLRRKLRKQGLKRAKNFSWERTVDLFLKAVNPH